MVIMRRFCILALLSQKPIERKSFCDFFIQEKPIICYIKYEK